MLVDISTWSNDPPLFKLSFLIILVFFLVIDIDSNIQSYKFYDMCNAHASVYTPFPIKLDIISYMTQRGGGAFSCFYFLIQACNEDVTMAIQSLSWGSQG